MIKVLITGITGMVGSHLLDYLLENTNWEIHGLIRWRSNLENIRNHANQIDKERIFLHYGDITDSFSIDKCISEIKPNYLFHLAAQSFPRTSFDAPLDTYSTNISGTEIVLNAIRRFAPDCITHICASSEVFGRVPSDRVPINEECSFHPASPYAISKVGTDLVARYYAEAYNLNVMSTRMFTHTGPRRGDIFAESSFAKQIALIEAGLQEPVLKTGNLDSMRTWADVRDAVRAYYMLVTVNPIPGSYYNIGGSFSCTIGEMLNSLLALSTNSKIKIETDPNRLRPIDADLQIPDVTKFKQHTGWSPNISFQETMNDLLNYWREKVASSDVVINR